MLALLSAVSFALSGTLWVLIQGGISGWILKGEYALGTGTLSLTSLGLSVSSIGVYVAIQIFQEQRLESQKAIAEENRLNRTLHRAVMNAAAAARRSEKKTEEAVDALENYFAEHPTKGDEQEATETDSVSDDVEPASGIRVVLDGENREVFSASEVPLRILREIVNEWDKLGLPGRWDLGAVSAAYRNLARDGSFRGKPWHVVFQDPETGDYEEWIVSTGGQAKRTSTVSRGDVPNQES